MAVEFNLPYSTIDIENEFQTASIKKLIYDGVEIKGTFDEQIFYLRDIRNVVKSIIQSEYHGADIDKSNAVVKVSLKLYETKIIDSNKTEQLKYSSDEPNTESRYKFGSLYTGKMDQTGSINFSNILSKTVNGKNPFADENTIVQFKNSFIVNGDFYCEKIKGNINKLNKFLLDKSNNLSNLNGIDYYVNTFSANNLSNIQNELDKIKDNPEYLFIYNLLTGYLSNIGSQIGEYVEQIFTLLNRKNSLIIQTWNIDTDHILNPSRQNIINEILNIIKHVEANSNYCEPNNIKSVISITDIKGLNKDTIEDIIKFNNAVKMSADILNNQIKNANVQLNKIFNECNLFKFTDNELQRDKLNDNLYEWLIERHTDLTYINNLIEEVQKLDTQKIESQITNKINKLINDLKVEFNNIINNISSSLINCSEICCNNVISLLGAENNRGGYRYSLTELNLYYLGEDNETYQTILNILRTALNKGKITEDWMTLCITDSLKYNLFNKTDNNYIISKIIEKYLIDNNAGSINPSISAETLRIYFNDNFKKFIQGEFNNRFSNIASLNYHKSENGVLEIACLNSNNSAEFINYYPCYDNIKRIYNNLLQYINATYNRIKDITELNGADTYYKNNYQDKFNSYGDMFKMFEEILGKYVRNTNKYSINYNYSFSTSKYDTGTINTLDILQLFEIYDSKLNLFSKSNQNNFELFDILQQINGSNNLLNIVNSNYLKERLNYFGEAVSEHFIAPLEKTTPINENNFISEYNKFCLDYPEKFFYFNGDEEYYDYWNNIKSRCEKVVNKFYTNKHESLCNQFNDIDFNYLGSCNDIDKYGKLDSFYNACSKYLYECDVYGNSDTSTSKRIIIDNTLQNDRDIDITIKLNIFDNRSILSCMNKAQESMSVFLSKQENEEQINNVHKQVLEGYLRELNSCNTFNDDAQEFSKALQNYKLIVNYQCSDTIKSYYLSEAQTKYNTVISNVVTNTDTYNTKLTNITEITSSNITDSEKILSDATNYFNNYKSVAENNQYLDLNLYFEIHLDQLSTNIGNLETKISEFKNPSITDEDNQI